MTLAIENTGFCVFGADPDTAPLGSAPTGAKFPPTGARCTVLCKYKGGVKIEKPKASGKSGTKQTFTGKKVAEVTVTIEWPDVDPTASLMLAAIATITPHGTSAGNPFDWTERFASIYKVGAVIVEEMEGPDPAKDSDNMVLKLKLSGFDKNQQANSGAGSSTTPTTSQRYTVTGTGALADAGVQFPSKPEVIPNP